MKMNSLKAEISKGCPLKSVFWILLCITISRQKLSYKERFPDGIMMVPQNKGSDVYEKRKKRGELYPKHI